MHRKKLPEVHLTVDLERLEYKVKLCLSKVEL